MAALMAQQGFTSSSRALEAPRGFTQVAAPQFNWNEITDELGKRFEISFNTYKPFACGIVSQPSMDACVQLKAMGYPLRNRIWYSGDGLPVASKEYRRIVNKSALAGFPREPKIKGARVPQHGTVTEYTTYKCRCKLCVDGYETHMSDRLGRPFVTRLRTVPAKQIHGTVACYKNGLCRCAPCSAANRQYKRSLRERQLAA